MKIHNVVLLLFFVLLCISCFQEQDGGPYTYQIQLQPDSYAGRDAVIMYSPDNDSIKDLNFGSSPSVLATAWKKNDTLIVTRSLIAFIITGISPEATIKSAYLSLYYNPNDNTYSGHSTVGGPNACWIERITTYWAEDTVSWNNQPPTSPDNAVLIDPSETPTQNYLSIDVTSLVQDMVENPYESFGFMIRLQTEQFYRAMVFASSDNMRQDLHPVLFIYFEE